MTVDYAAWCPLPGPRPVARRQASVRWCCQEDRSAREHFGSLAAAPLGNHPPNDTHIGSVEKFSHLSVQDENTQLSDFQFLVELSSTSVIYFFSDRICLGGKTSSKLFSSPAFIK